MTDCTRQAEIAALRAAIGRSGLSTSEYARTVLVRDPRTVRRWLAGDRQVPQAVLERITAPEPGDTHDQEPPDWREVRGDLRYHEQREDAL